MLPRLLMFAVLVWVVARVLKAGLQTLAGGQPMQPAPVKKLTPLPMVACAHCGLHIPQEEAVLRQGQPYCCNDHAERA